MPPLAQRNLFRDKLRLAVTLTGITFAVVLIVIELGLFVGFSAATSTLIDHTESDLWVTSKKVPYIELGVPFSERKFYQVRTVPGVASAQKLISRWTGWKRPDGRQESIQVVGFNLDAGVGGPWDLVEGRVEDLRLPDSVILDEIYKAKLGVQRRGEVFEINGHRARVVGFTRGIRTFTTSPYIFTTFKRAQDFSNLAADQTMFVLVKLGPHADPEQVRRAIQERVQDVDVLTRAEFSAMTQKYWMFTTGAGVAVLMAAVLGLIVGFAIVAQTIYATTMDHLREFGTLKALGAPNGYVYRVIIKQATLSALMGYALGMGVSCVVIAGSARAGAAISLPPTLAVAMLFLTLLMCVGAALVSINKVMHLDPAMVFKG